MVFLSLTVSILCHSDEGIWINFKNPIQILRARHNSSELKILMNDLFISIEFLSPFSLLIWLAFLPPLGTWMVPTLSWKLCSRERFSWLVKTFCKCSITPLPVRSFRGLSGTYTGLVNPSWCMMTRPKSEDGSSPWEARDRMSSNVFTSSRWRSDSLPFRSGIFTSNRTR